MNSLPCHEQIVLLQKTEKFDYDQLTLCFNEAEVTIETDCAEEPLIEEVIPAYKRKKKTERKT